MKKIKDSEEFREIINDLKNKKFNQALEKTKLISKKYPNENIVLKLYATIYFKLMDWKNAIKYYEKNLFFDNEKYKIYTNIGVALFKLGKINQSIQAFKDSIKDNQNFGLAHNNLGISYVELGMYEKAVKHFVVALKLNSNDINIQSNLINIFNFYIPKNINEHSLININNKINNLKINNKEKKLDFTDENIKLIIDECNNLINNYKENLFLNETQIFRKNSENLNCNRHFKIFNEFNIIPKYCFSCYKVQINLKTVVDLVKLFLIFDEIKFKNNNIRKCIVELRNKIKGNYKGYIYCNSVDEVNEIKNKISEIITDKLNVLSIDIKHGCTEFYKSYPQFENINFNGKQQMNYNENWIEKENIIDSREPVRLKLDKKVWTESVNGINLSDILIINNWINYAHIIGDQSYKNIYRKKIKDISINKTLRDQLKLRKEDLNI